MAMLMDCAELIETAGVLNALHVLSSSTKISGVMGMIPPIVRMTAKKMTMMGMIVQMPTIMPYRTLNSPGKRLGGICSDEDRECEVL